MADDARGRPQPALQSEARKGGEGPGRIEDYGLIGDCESAALVRRDGSVDWLCWPRFDSPACFAALLGGPEHGRWRIAPRDEEVEVARRYRPGTLILETVFETAAGAVRLTDFMPERASAPQMVRLVEGLRGEVEMALELILRFDYGSVTPWVTRGENGALHAVAGPDMVVLNAPVDLQGRGMTTEAAFTVRADEAVAFVLTYGPSHLPPPAPIEPFEALDATEAFWTEWNRTCRVDGPYEAAIRRSLVTLKALTHSPTGGIVAAPTTSLPEQFGGERNWDYRYCWIRDATLLLLGLMSAGHFEEARAWTNWLHRAVAGDPKDMQIMYGLTGERRLTEWEADWLPGYEGARPVRIGNAAHSQLQIDVYGELMDATHQARINGLTGDATWGLQLEIMKHLAEIWDEPDEGIWEVRSGRRHFTFSKIMAWVAVDRAIKSVETFGLEGPVDDWRALRERIHAEVCERAINPRTGGFQRAYDDPSCDASLLLIGELGFLPPDDPRFAATVVAAEQELMTPDGLVMRYDSESAEDGLPPGEGAFLVCSFWMVNAYVMIGRREEGAALFERLLAYSNDLGLLSEEHDPESGRMAGNFPQALSHIGLLSAALNLTHHQKPAEQRAGRQADGAADTSR